MILSLEKLIKELEETAATKEYQYNNLEGENEDVKAVKDLLETLFFELTKMNEETQEDLAFNEDEGAKEVVKAVVPKCLVAFLKGNNHRSDSMKGIAIKSLFYNFDRLDEPTFDKLYQSKGLYDWVNKTKEVGFILADALRYGWQVEREPLFYLHVFPGDNGYLKKDKSTGKLFTGAKLETSQFQIKFTEKEIFEFKQKENRDYTNFMELIAE